MRTLRPAGYRRADEPTFGVLASRFDTQDTARWRERRAPYRATAQGAGQAPPLPFFDRGTFEQIVEVGP